MSLRLPQVSGRQLVRLLESSGYVISRQRGSHFQMRKSFPAGNHNVTVPNHREVAKGTLGDILQEVSLWNQMSRERLIQLLREL